MDNLYASPSSNLGGPESYAAGGVSDRVADIMRRTQPWARLSGILLFVGVLLTVINLIVIAVRTDAGSAAGAGVGSIIQIFLQVYLGTKLLRYASRIDSVLASRQAQDLAAALDEHRSYWKVQGILYIIVMVFILLAIIAAAAIAGSRS